MLYEESYLEDDDGYLFIADTDSYLDMSAYTGSIISSWVITGDGFSTVAADASCTVSTDQDIDFTVYKADAASRIDLNYTGGDWNGDPTDLNDAVTRIASSVAVLLTHPI